MREACTARGWELARVESDVVSGATIRRPGLEAVLADCRSGVLEGLVVAKLDRLSRSLLDFATLLEDATKHGYNIVALDLGIDLGTPTGELVANVMMAVAQWERRAIADRTKAALAEAVSRGVRLGRPPETDPRVERVIGELREAGWSWAWITNELITEGVPPPRGGKVWHQSTVRQIAARVLSNGAR